MYKIKIDTTERYKKEVVLLEVTADGKETVLERMEGDIDVVSSIKEVLEKRHLQPDQVEDYDYDQGPGSFTGLKIGATISNVMNWALGKKSVKELKYPEYGREPNITLKKDL